MLPSNDYIDLTLGASGSSYTAPANGWFVLSKNSGASGKYIAIAVINKNVITANILTQSSYNGLMSVYVPIKKDNTAVVEYSATGTTNKFRFVYAEGEQSIIKY